MNAAGREALRQAALNGVRQITGVSRDKNGGRCGLGVLADAARAEDLYGVRRTFDLTGEAPCPLCPSIAASFREMALLPHLNDWHGLDFLGLASKMPESDEL